MLVEMDSGDSVTGEDSGDGVSLSMQTLMGVDGGDGVSPFM